MIKSSGLHNFFVVFWPLEYLEVHWLGWPLEYLEVHWLGWKPQKSIFPISFFLVESYSSGCLDVNKKIFQSRPHKRNSKGIFKPSQLHLFSSECARKRVEKQFACYHLVVCKIFSLTYYSRLFWLDSSAFFEWKMWCVPRLLKEL